MFPVQAWLDDEDELNRVNRALLERLQLGGEAFLPSPQLTGLKGPARSGRHGMTDCGDHRTRREKLSRRGPRTQRLMYAEKATHDFPDILMLDVGRVVHGAHVGG